MNRFKPRLIALDMDGTILNDASEISVRTKSAIRSAISFGIAVSVATGRMYPSALPVMSEIGIRSPSVFYNGALVRDPVSCDTLYEKGLGRELTAEILSFFREQGWYVQIYSNDRLYVIDNSDPRSKFYENISKITPISLGEKFWNLDVDSTKILGISLDEAAFKYMAEMTKSRFGSRIYMATSWGAFVEIAHPEVNKANGLAVVAERLGIPRRDVLAIGDAGNDREMIKWAGHGVAMGNAPDRVKEIADEIAPDNENDGAAVIIERYLSGGDLR